MRKTIKIHGRRVVKSPEPQKRPKVWYRRSPNVCKGKLEFEYINWTLKLADESGNKIVIAEDYAEYDGMEVAPPAIPISKITDSDPKKDHMLRSLRNLLEPLCDKYLDVQLKAADWVAISKEIVSENMLNPKSEEHEDETEKELEEIPMEYRVEAAMLKQEGAHTVYLVDTIKLKVLEQEDVIPFRVVLHYSVLLDRIEENYSSTVLHPVASADSSGGKTHMENTLFELTPEQYINTFGRDYTLAYISRETMTKGKNYMYRHYNRFGDMGNLEEHNQKDPMVQMKKKLKSENKFSRGLSESLSDNTIDNVELEIIGGGQIIEEETEVKGEEQEENRVVRWNPNCGVFTRKVVQINTDNEIASLKANREFQERKTICRAIIDSNFSDLAAMESQLQEMGYEYEIRSTIQYNIYQCIRSMEVQWRIKV